MLMNARILFQIGSGELEQCRRRTQMVPLQMHERAGQLDQAFVKRAVRAMPVMNPQMFQHLVGLVKKLPVEAMEKSEVMRIEFSVIETLDHRGDAFALAAHGFKVKSRVQSLKPKVVQNSSSGR